MNRIYSILRCGKNRRFRQITVSEDQGTPQVINEWSTFDEADRPIISGGFLDPETGKITIGWGQGFISTHSGGLRIREEIDFTDG